MTRPRIDINVVGAAGSGKSSIAWLIADFLQYTGFSTELNMPDDFDGSSDELLKEWIESIPDRLEGISNRDTLIVINEVQARRDSV